MTGLSKTSWTESSKNSGDKKYQGEHEYFKKIFLIIGAGCCKFLM